MSESFFGADDEEEVGSSIPETVTKAAEEAAEAAEAAAEEAFENATEALNEAAKELSTTPILVAVCIIVVSAILVYINHLRNKKERARTWVADIDATTYEMELPEESISYDGQKESGRCDKPTLCRLLHRRAMADIPLIERLEKELPQVSKVHRRGMVPRQVWDDVQEAELMMRDEVEDVRKEANRLQKGWGDHIFPQAYQDLKKMREEQEGNAEAKERVATKQTREEQYKSLVRVHSQSMVCGWCMCTAGEENLKSCGGCGEVFYCDKNCQVLHWKEGGHKESCSKKKIKEDLKLKTECQPAASAGKAAA